MGIVNEFCYFVRIARIGHNSNFVFPKFGRYPASLLFETKSMLRLSILDASQAVDLLYPYKVGGLLTFIFCADSENRTRATCLGSTRTATILHPHFC